MQTFDVIIVGKGNAALCAALSAREMAPRWQYSRPRLKISLAVTVGLAVACFGSYAGAAAAQYNA